MNFIKPLLIFFMYCTVIYSQTWVVQPNPAVGNIIQIHAVNENIVYAGTTTQILKTTNGGANWSVVLNMPWRNLKGFQVVIPPVGLHRIYTWYHTGFFYYRSVNSGISWDSVTVPGNTGYMEFFNGPDDSVYYINSGQSGTSFWKTTNSGFNWYSYNASYGSMNAMSSFHFINGETGFVNGGSSYTSYQILLKTTNAGFTWTPTDLLNNGYGSGGDFWFHPTSGIGYHVSNKTYKTINYGDNWTVLNTQGGGVHALFMHSQFRGWLGKQSGLLKTTDGCATWVNQNIGVSGVDIHSVSFINYNTGWIAGESGHILKTTNGSGVLVPVLPPISLAPPNGSSGISLTPWLQFNPPSFQSMGIEDSLWFRVQLSADSTFTTTLINTDTVTITQYQVPSGILNHNIRYYWRVRAINLGGEGPWSPVWNFRTGLVGLNQTGSKMPSAFKLYVNYPNPFNPVTKIRFDIPEQSFTKLMIYDISGKEVLMTVNRELNPGSYEAEFNASNLPSGVYFYKLTSGKFTDVKKMILVK